MIILIKQLQFQIIILNIKQITVIWHHVYLYNYVYIL